MKMIKWLALASLVLLSACGGGTETGRGTAVTQTSATADAASELRKALSAAPIQAATPEQAADQLFNFAQTSSYASIFPGNPPTLSYAPFRYRAYSNGVLLGVVVEPGADYTMDGVYVMGGAFGPSPILVGRLTDFVTPVEPGPLLVFSPPLVQVTSAAGESRPFDITARWYTNVDDQVNLEVVDRSGVIAPEIALNKGYDGQGKWIAYVAKLRTAATLPAGVHEGYFELKLCRDSTAVCSNPLPGSPLRVPYRITIEVGSSFKPLRPLAGAAPWATMQGNAAHNGYVAATVNPTNFTRRFAWPGNARNVVIDNGRVLAVVRSTGDWALQAISEEDGRVLWNTRIANADVSPPAVVNGKAYVVTFSAMEVFDVQTGVRSASVSRNQFGADTALAPTPYRGKIYAKTQDRGGISRLDEASNRFDWSNTFSMFSRSTPAVDDAYAYACGNDFLHVFDANTGSVVAEIAKPGSGGSGSVFLPVLDGAGSAFVTEAEIGRGKLFRFDLVKRTRAWTLDLGFQSPPVLANGTLYVTNDRGLDARTPSSGELQWSWRAPGADYGSPHLVVVGNLAFFGVGNTTYAVDLNTRQSVWSYPLAGPLAVSANGVLYISGTQTLVGIDLH